MEEYKEETEVNRKVIVIEGEGEGGKVLVIEGEG